MNLSALKIDPEFQGKIPPLNAEEEHILEQNMIQERRLLNPLIIWNGYIEAILCPCWVSLAAKTMFFSASATAWQFKIFTSICLIGMSLLYNRFQ